MVEKYIKSNMCHLPWTSIETRPNGRYKPCCLYNKDLEDNGIQYNTKEHTISDVIHSPAMQNLREQFLRGEKPQGCESCWKEEQAGKTSKRQYMWYKASEFGETYLKKNRIAPAFVDLKLGNVCNLKCRICSPHSSSQWVNDMIKLDPQRKQHWQKFNKEGLWPREKNKFFDDISDHIDSIRFFEITGGEPLLIKEQFDILQKCIDKGVANKIEVHYNTNGTQYPEKAVKEIWPHFKKIELAFSIDDIGHRFEYQRHLAKWDNVEKNILKFINSDLKNLSIQICTTINFFNIFYIDELAKKVNEWRPDFWYINILHNPIEFDIQQLPHDIKNQIEKKINKSKFYKNEIQSAINYLNGSPVNVQKDWKELLSLKIKSIDNIRNENFSLIFPELNNLTKIYD
jgi:MoaA/NifB/PqqE/SkfB family radical SAM enzyme